ncbi:ATP-dependent Clp protease proteolytic subunit [Candidatus Saccharibacteria bacterium]|nr:ATP-dependent Clp protease proteolytic subunit [Candidatus Saccharibacteria bacterium]
MSLAADNIISDLHTSISCNMFEFGRAIEMTERRLYLYGTIYSIDMDEQPLYYDASKMSKLAEFILDYNRIDEDIAPEEREPIRLYINSPGGDVTEGFALIDVMEASKTPIYTINLAEACSMAFLIGITGTKRFSLPSATFMMHEPSGLTVGKFSDMADKVAFNQRYQEMIIKNHVMKHSTMTEQKYSSVSTKDFYMLSCDALKYGFIDEIVTDISSIL